MQLSTTEFRSQICHSLIHAGIVLEQDIIAKATILEQYVFGTATPVVQQPAPVSTPTPVPEETTQQPDAVEDPALESTVVVEEPQTEAPTYTAKDVKEILIKIASKNPTAKRHTEILQKYGAEKLSDLKEADFSAAYIDAQALLESM